MIKLKIDHKEIEVPEGTTILVAASMLGIEIPTLCHMQGVSVHPSCMVCTVKDIVSGKLFPSCAMPVLPNMDIITDSEDLISIRKEALELLLSDHAGDCEAPCRLSCPAFMDIPRMNRLIAEGNFEKALEVVRQEIALPLILGYVCPAPCEKACRRKPIDGTVSICLLKRSTATNPDIRSRKLDIPIQKSGKRIGIIGTGPAGLSAAFYLLRMGHECVLFDQQEEAGGALRYSIKEDILPREVLDAEIEVLRMMGASFVLNSKQTLRELGKANGSRFDALVLATGSQEQHTVDELIKSADGTTRTLNRKTYETRIEGVFACGSILRDQRMAVRAGAQGKAAALNVDRFLRGMPATQEDSLFNSSIGELKEEEYVEYLKESKVNNPVNPGKGFTAGYSPEEAMEEARRCMHCDCRKPVTCKLRNLSHLYKADKKRFAGPDRKHLLKSMQHELIIYEQEKCIKCGICIEIASKASEALGLSFIGRGFDVKVSVPFNKTTLEALKTSAIECANACPTGALATKLSEENDILTVI
ncbi:MAG: (2Fe-2S)-binding protein [Bacteroidetes bacterium]|nr:(2Fe-2S)-binding protein [Bacteroidota bacterium]